MRTFMLKLSHLWHYLFDEFAHRFVLITAQSIQSRNG